MSKSNTPQDKQADNAPQALLPLKLEFRQLNPIKAGLAVVAYLSLIIAGLLFYWGWERVLDYVNSFSGEETAVKALGFVVGVVVVIPVIFFRKWVADRAKINFTTEMIYLTINGEKFVIKHSDISAFVFNDFAMKTLVIKGENDEILAKIYPICTTDIEQAELVKKMTGHLQSQLRFKRHEQVSKQFNLPVVAVIYQRPTSTSGS